MDKNHEQVWQSCLQIIRDNVPAASFNTWFRPIVPLRMEEKVLTIQVPSPFFYEYLEEHYIEILRKTLRRVVGQGAKLEYNVVMHRNIKTGETNKTVQLPTRETPPPQNRPINMPLTTENHGIRNPFVIPGIKKLHVDPQLNPFYSFENFIEGKCNRLARSAGSAVAQNPGGTAYNPLLLYGESGLGKTHLAQAIGLEVKERFPEKVVLYVSANKFQTQFTEAIRNNNKNDFLHFYQMIDVLIIDDIHEFAGKDKTQDTFFHIFNHLHQLGKQIILTTDKPPVELKGLEARLLSRFKWGLTTDITTPDYDTRLSILKRKMYRDGFEIPEEVIEYVAKNIVSNIRELEGALISLLAQATLTKKEITLTLAQDIVKKLVKYTKKEVSVNKIVKTVTEHFNVDPEALHSRSRKREIVTARQVAMYFAKKLTKLPLSAIGVQIGKRDHATVLHADKTVKNLLETDRSFRAHVTEIEKKLQG